MLWYTVNLFIIFIFLSLFVIFRKTNKQWSKINDYLNRVINTVNSIRYGNLAAKLEETGQEDYRQLSGSINRLVETLNDREKMIVEYQNELRRQNKFLESVINSLSEGIMIIDNNHKILRVTPQIIKWFGEENKDLLNKNILNYIQPKNNTPCEEFKEDEIFIKNAPEMSFEASTMKLILDDKQTGFVMIIKDTTNQKELEKLREDFIATLTHDLKVPIVAESNILEFLINGKFGEVTVKQNEAISNMRSCNQELLELVQILLETYKVDEAGIDLVKEEIDLSSFTSSIIEEMRPIAEKSGLNLNFKSLDNLKISADNIQLKRVIKNLIQNAISHSGANKNIEGAANQDIDVIIKQIPNYVTIRIIDYGKGISKENLDKIFNKYYSTAQKFRKIGTGLGLYLSQQIVKAHGGEITVFSEENVCTEFCIKLGVNEQINV